MPERMHLTLALEARFCRTPDNKVWSPGGIDGSFWRRYLDIYQFLKVVARIQNVTSVSESFDRLDNERVQFIPFPYYIGPYQYLRNHQKISRIAKEVVNASEAVLLRVPGQLSTRIFQYLNEKGHPYGVEVVGDPYDVFAPGAVDHALRFFFRWWGTKQLKKQCKKAIAVAYVTKFALQRRYPAQENAFIAHYSSIDLSKDFFASPRKFYNRVQNRIIFVGSLAQMYKAPDILIKSISRLQALGRDVHLTIVGDGVFRPTLEFLVKDLKLASSVEFLGQISSGKAVMDELDKADLFVLPSRTEGIPRAMIEAMARGLPCIGSVAGGIPELLDPKYLVPPGDVPALAAKIDEALSHPRELAKMSARNIEKAKEYSDEILSARRVAFYQELKQRTAKWMAEIR